MHDQMCRMTVVAAVVCSFVWLSVSVIRSTVVTVQPLQIVFQLEMDEFSQASWQTLILIIGLLSQMSGVPLE